MEAREPSGEKNGGKPKIESRRISRNIRARQTRANSGIVFKEFTMSEKVLPPWADQMPEGAFISYGPTNKVGEFFDRFHKENFDGIDCYFYDPTEHGWAKDKKYPVLVFMHGYGNALEGDVCINYAGAEFYSKEEYQKDTCYYKKCHRN